MNFKEALSIFLVITSMQLIKNQLLQEIGEKPLNKKDLSSQKEYIRTLIAINGCMFGQFKLVKVDCDDCTDLVNGVNEKFNNNRESWGNFVLETQLLSLLPASWKPNKISAEIGISYDYA